ncbi:MAG: sterol desaturase family protein [Planctomycetota bacterium]
MIQALIHRESAHLIACGIYAAVAVLLLLILRRIDSTWNPVLRGDGEGKSRGRVTLGQAAWEFVGIHSLQFLFAGLIASLVIRLALGGWTMWDAVILVGTIVVWPLQEWLGHVYLLHMKSFRLFGRTIEPVFIKTHRNHHRDVREPISGVVPTYFVAMYLLGLPFIWHIGLALPQAFTGVTTSLVLLATYEWVHFLIHTSYKPRGRWYSSLWRNHRLHHFKNENCWFGVTTIVADVVLGTHPDQQLIGNSDTCLTLAAPEEHSLPGDETR